MLQQRVISTGNQRTSMRGLTKLGSNGFSWGQIVAFEGNNIPNAATRIRDVTQSTRNDVNVEMRDRLAASRAFIEADIESVRRIPIAKQPLRLADPFAQLALLFSSQVSPNRNMSSRHEKQVTFCHRIPIP